LSLDLDRYRAEADEFVSAISLEHYLHFSGQKEEFEIEAIYERHADLFSREAVDALREAGNRELLEFAVQGHMGQQTKAEEAELARREATLTLTVAGEEMPLRQSSVVQANETDPERRAAIERARIELSKVELTPLRVEVHERAAALARELGWPSMLDLCEELSGIDLAALDAQTQAFLAATDPGYEEVVEPELERHLGLRFDSLRRSDIPAFFRAPSLDAAFPAQQLVGTLRKTLTGLGIELDAQGNVTVDAESRPTKSPRAFCAPVRVPEEVYLVIAPVGGRDDYEALLHEAGHTEHFAHVTPGLPFERRHLGDNSFTEAFAFLFQYLAQSPTWLAEVLETEAEPIAGYANAVNLIFLRRYAAKLAYERRLHAAGAELTEMPGEYARRLTDAIHVAWPEETWIADVDPFFYSARYLRAWAVERTLRAHLVGRFGERWFAEPAAGDLLKQIWSKGQRASAEELLEELGSPPAIDFAILTG
jgi:oligoendopeptidase F